MDTTKFDTLVRSFGQTSTRRQMIKRAGQALGAALAGTLARFAAQEAAACAQCAQPCNACAAWVKAHCTPGKPCDSSKSANCRNCGTCSARMCR